MTTGWPAVVLRAWWILPEHTIDAAFTEVAEAVRVFRDPRWAGHSAAPAVSRQPPTGVHGWSRMDISVIGLGKVGLSLASCLVAAGHKVIGAISIRRSSRRSTGGLFDPGARRPRAAGPGAARLADGDHRSGSGRSRYGADLRHRADAEQYTRRLFAALRAARATTSARDTAKSAGHTVAIVSTVLPIERCDRDARSSRPQAARSAPTFAIATRRSSRSARS